MNKQQLVEQIKQKKTFLKRLLTKLLDKLNIHAGFSI